MSGPTRPCAAAAVVCALLGACSSTAPDSGGLEAGGLLRADAEAPVGADSWDRPVLLPGDRFTFRRGGVLELDYVVAEPDESAAEGEIELWRDGGLMRIVLDADLGSLREENPSRVTSATRPVDPQFSWPLWVGKRWAGEFVPWDEEGGASPFAVSVEYHCDARERVVTPAGSFEALRIWRRAIPRDAGGEFLPRESIYWYAPDVGYHVKWLERGVVTELTDYRKPR